MESLEFGGKFLGTKHSRSELLTVSTRTLHTASQELHGSAARCPQGPTACSCACLFHHCGTDKLPATETMQHAEVRASSVNGDW